MPRKKKIEEKPTDAINSIIFSINYCFSYIEDIVPKSNALLLTLQPEIEEEPFIMEVINQDNYNKKIILKSNLKIENLHELPIHVLSDFYLWLQDLLPHLEKMTSSYTNRAFEEFKKRTKKGHYTFIHAGCWHPPHAFEDNDSSYEFVFKNNEGKLNMWDDFNETPLPLQMMLADEVFFSVLNGMTKIKWRYLENSKVNS